MESVKKGDPVYLFKQEWDVCIKKIGLNLLGAPPGFKIIWFNHPGNAKKTSIKDFLLLPDITD